MKKIASIALALILVLAMAAPAMAADGYTITIHNETSGYTYAAYQIFAGDLSEKTLSNIVWGSGVDTEKTVGEGDDAKTLIQALNTLEAFTACRTAADVAEVLAKDTTMDNETAKAFADVVGNYLTGTNKTSDYDDTNKKYTITVSAAGYYLVKNTTVPGNKDTAYTRYILEVVENVEVSPKGTVPEVDKDIIDNNQNVDENEASIGDTITYEWTGTLPSNIADYDTYYYVFNDTMDKGLTLTDTDEATEGIQTNVKVEIVNDNNKIDVTQYFYISATENTDTDGNVTETTLKVGIEDLLALKHVDTDSETEGLQGITINASTKIVVTYTATLNENAVVGTNGNENKVDLEYSNDPNDDGEPSENPPSENPEEPKPTHPTGKTPESKVETFTTEIIIKKVDEKGNILTGAEFTITGNGVNMVVVTKAKYVEDVDGEYWLLANGTYTTTAPTIADDETDNSADYADVNKKYTLKTEVETQTKSETTKVAAYVGADGTVKFTGLGAGEYIIKETVTPAGYNTVADSTVKITWDQNGEDCTWSYQWNNGEASNSNTITIVNVAGSILPSTGGMGTTIFYVAGGLLVVAAIVLLISKRKAEAK